MFLAAAAWGCWRSPVPAAAWAQWAAWALHLGAAWALWPVIRARPGLLVAGLFGGLAGELLLLIGQGTWERAALQRAFRDDPNLVGRDDLREQFAVRVGSWRLEGSFLLANTLAAYLITLWPLLADLTWRCRGPARWTAGTLLVLASGGLAFSGSKAGILALLVALAVTGVLLIPAWRWRAAIIAGALAICAAAALVPWVRTHVAASADVRVGYWQAACAMVAERPWSGFGLDGFESAFPRLKPAWVEDTIFAHQETLQAAADLGCAGGARAAGLVGGAAGAACGHASRRRGTGRRLNPPRLRRERTSLAATPDPRPRASPGPRGRWPPASPCSRS